MHCSEDRVEKLPPSQEIQFGNYPTSVRFFLSPNLLINHPKNLPTGPSEKDPTFKVKQTPRKCIGSELWFYPTALITDSLSVYLCSKKGLVYNAT